MRVYVVYAQPGEQVVETLEVSPGVNVADVLALVAQTVPFSSLDLAAVPVGIFGEPVARDAPLQPGDRVEIYRPLSMDPKEARRLRARSPGQSG